MKEKNEKTIIANPPKYMREHVWAAYQLSLKSYERLYLKLAGSWDG